MSTETSTEAYEEVVTEAKLRYVNLPAGAGRAALITLDNGRDHTRPNTFGLAGLRSLSAALDEVAAKADAGEIVAVAITGKAFIFAVGADLTGIAALRSRDDAMEVARAGHDTFRRLGELAVPSFALVNGAAMGGGLETALHCTYRTVSTGAGVLALPEVFLGLVPGWGGAWLLPNLIGAERAIKVIVENPLNNNRTLTPSQAHKLGIADVLLDSADFIAESLRWVGRVVTGEDVVTRTPVDRGEGWDLAVSAGRDLARSETADATPAPGLALDLIEAARTATRDEGFAAEDNILSDLIMSDQLRASLYSFDLVQRRAKRPVGAPSGKLARPIGKVGVVGAGLMASQLAMLFAQRLLVPVVITDLDQTRVDRGIAYVHAEIDKLHAKGRIKADMANRLRGLVTGSTSKDGFADADVVIEAVFEDLKVKQQVFAEVEAVVSETCVLLTNTSSLSVTEMASALRHPERVVGFHFFNPVALMPLVEIARTPATDDPSLATAFALAKSLKKNAVLVTDAPAFVVNRLLTRFLGEVVAAVDRGTPFDTANDALAPLGLPMSPYLLLQLVGPAVAYHVSETMHEAFPDRFAVSANQRRIVESGKTELLAWDAAGTARLADDVVALHEFGAAPSTGEAVRQRALDALAEEIGLMLSEGVVAEAQDIDLCMLLGAGWPFHLGGVTPYLDRSGTSERVTGHRFLSAGVASL